jgi:coatomer protein complex subunit epsilon
MRFLRWNFPALLAIKLLSTYLSDPSSHEIAKLQVQEWLSSASQNNSTLRLVAAIIYLHEDNYKEALRSLRFERSLEQSALLIQIYLRINQPELAKQTLKQMKLRDEDSVLVTLANAWINLSPVGRCMGVPFAL